MKKLMPLVGSILGLFVFSMLFFLFLNGMLVPKPPFLRAAKGYVASDSTETSAVQGMRQAGDAQRGATPSGQSRQNTNDATETRPPAREDAAPPIPETGTPTPAQGTIDNVEGGGRATTNASPQAASGTGVDDAAEEIDDKLPFDPEKMAHLVRVYEKMRPKQVGLILNTMPDAQSVVVLSSMRERAAAQVMATMEPSKAARMSQLLVERGQK